MKKLSIIVVGCIILCTALFAKNDTYIYDFWAEYEKSPDAYRVAGVYYASALGADIDFKAASNLYCEGDSVFVCDSGNNRILELRYTEQKTLELVRVIDRFNANGEAVIETFNEPSDIFINKDRTIFIADTNNARVLKLDNDLNLLMTFEVPNDPTYEEGKAFLPVKVVADAKGRAYVLARNINKGFIKYEYDGTFSGFFGASEVLYNALDLLWKRLATRAQREQMENFVPTEYSNCYMDREGFIYAVTKSFKEWDLLSDKAKPIRRLNALGKDILVKNGEYLPVGDLQWGNGGGIKDPAKFVDITVLENDVYIAMDETHGRAFAYNNQGQLLFAFGGRGNIDGFFRQPASIEHIGRDLFVLDSIDGSITVFTPTRYGHLIYDATEDFAVGEYDASAAKWEQVLAINGNYDLAYIGLGKAALRQERYKEAMDYFKVKRSHRNYSKAFVYYRKEWIEEHIGQICIVLAIIVFVPFIVSRIKRFITELNSL